MATDVTVGLDPFDRVIRINFDNVETGGRGQAELDEDAAEKIAAEILAGRRAFVSFKDTITGRMAGLDLTSATETANHLRAAASDLRAHKAGQIDLRTATGRVPKA